MTSEIMTKMKLLSIVVSTATFGVSELDAEIVGEKLAAGFERVSEEEASSGVRGFVERDGKMMGKIDPFTYSTFIVSGGRSSFVPTDAILYVPEEMKDRIATEKKGSLVLWPKFYRSNRSYFHTVEVTPEEFTGKKPISEGRMKQLMSIGRIVITVYRGNPISVPKPKQELGETVMAD